MTTESVEPAWHAQFRKSFTCCMEREKVRNWRFSIRGYAEKVSLSAGAMTELVSGRRCLSKQRALALLTKLELPDREANRLHNLITQPDIGERTPLHDYELMLNDWVYLAVLHFFDLDVGDRSPQTISTRLSIPVVKIQEVIVLLSNNGLLHKNLQGHWQRNSEEQLKTPDGLSSEAVRNYHHEGLTLAGLALENIPLDQRDFTSIIFAANSQKIDSAKKQIREMYREIVVPFTEPPRNQLYRLSVSLIPLTKEET